jgi:hypothetical protein
MLQTAPTTAHCTGIDTLTNAESTTHRLGIAAAHIASRTKTHHAMAKIAAFYLTGLKDTCLTTISTTGSAGTPVRP